MVRGLVWQFVPRTVLLAAAGQLLFVLRFQNLAGTGIRVDFNAFAVGVTSLDLIFSLFQFYLLISV